MNPLPFLSVSVIPSICVTIWCFAAGQEKKELLPILYCFLSVQVMNLIYNMILLLVTIHYCCTISFYIVSMAVMVWISPYLLTASCSWLLLSTMSVEVIITMWKVIYITKRRCEFDLDAEEEGMHYSEGEDRGTECGAYIVRETRKEWEGGEKGLERGKWSSGYSLVI